MKTHSVFVDGVIVGSRLRRLNPEVVSVLAESIASIGLLQPISVYAPDDSTVYLVTGNHRLEAAKKLGWDLIDAVLVTGDELDREMREITENLHRAELSALERSEQIARWAELTAAKVLQVATPTGGQQPKEKGIRKIARDLKIETTDVQRAVKVAGLSNKAKDAAREHKLDNNRSALLEAARETEPEAQVAKIANYNPKHYSRLKKLNIRNSAHEQNLPAASDSIPATDIKCLKDELRSRKDKMRNLKVLKDASDSHNNRLVDDLRDKAREARCLSERIEELQEENRKLKSQQVPIPLRGRDAICDRVREMVVTLSGLPPAHEVAGYFDGADSTIIISERILQAATWFAAFSDKWRGHDETGAKPSRPKVVAV
jgi:ParB/RepB/Spo0J family partition protein